ncbi:MAG: 1-acyl-sn-glycerol-3-phosphate acyltransferase [Pyrinomonadaceae bacterium]|nr:1-acyl-sn-glycerol-3-phosphate acyltransferase [Pyrinomonadaceae bacterium]
MITARKSAWFERLFAVYNRNLIARRFEGLRVAGLEHLKARQRDCPLILYANHSSWWDGLMIFQVGLACSLEQYAMMEERQLRDYPLFRKLGAFSVVRERPREAVRSIEYAGELLRNTDRVLWIFPQGQTLPNDQRPFQFYTGAAHIIEQAGGAYVAPVALRYEFLDDFRPEALVRIDAPERITAAPKFNAKQLTNAFADRLTRTLDQVRCDVLAANFADYEEIVAPHRRREKIPLSS